MTARRPKRPAAWYALRRTLPTWSFEENLAELVEKLPAYGVDEVIVKVDTEEFFHGQPPMDWVRDYIPRLHRVREAMETIGVVYSLNPWITLGHCDRGRDGSEQIPGLGTMVGIDGTVCRCCACPIDPAWREHVRQVWGLYASTRPQVVWVEDDIRIFNHRPVEWGCFCERHMEEFSRRVGREVGREELAAALTAPGQPHPWRGEWMDMHGELMADTVGHLARAVHAASPKTSMGLMSSGPRRHAMEGRDWTRFCDRLADGQTLYSRPTMGNYSEKDARDLYYAQDSIKITRLCTPAGTIEQTELENVPFTRYSKSVNFTFAQLALSFAYGCAGVTMNLFDHAGTAMEAEPWFGRMLGEGKPHLNALARRTQRPGRYRGLRLLFSPEVSRLKRLGPGAGMDDLWQEDAEVTALEGCGLATTYEAGESVAVSTGQMLRGFDDEQIRGLLSGGLLLDVEAAGVLVERGFGEQIGLDGLSEPMCVDALGVYAAEEFFEPRFGGAERTYLTLTVPDLGGRPLVSPLAPAAGATVISRLVDPDARRGPVAMYAFENALGGRVVVHGMAWGSAVGTAFLHPFRVRQLGGAAEWLARGAVPIRAEAGALPLCWRKDLDDGRTVAGLMNLTRDPWENSRLLLGDGRAIERVDVLGPTGRWGRSRAARWSPRREGLWELAWDKPLSFERPLAVTVHWAS
jgi:hypothetical protein